MDRATFCSEHVQNTSCSDHFLKFRCRKIVRRPSVNDIPAFCCVKGVVLETSVYHHIKLFPKISWHFAFAKFYEVNMTLDNPTNPTEQSHTLRKLQLKIEIHE